MQPSAFRRALKYRILDKLIPDWDRKERSRDQLKAFLGDFVGNLEYDINPAKIKATLLLFNIASIIANDKSIVRFRFDYFKQENWDIEHIRSIDSGRPTSNADKRHWMETLRNYFDDVGGSSELRARADAMLLSRGYTTSNEFDILYDEVIKHFNEQEPTEAENGIGNLALLDSGSNRAYKNAVFPIKRKLLLRYDQEGVFVPICTRNAFLKCYSGEKVENMFFWGANDQTFYRAAIVNQLTDFFTN